MQMSEQLSVKIPADVDRPDKVLAGLTTRQIGILAGTAVLLWAGWVSLGPWLGVAGFAVLAVPVAGAGIAVALLRRDGLGLDEWVLAALVHLVGRKHHHDPAAPATALSDHSEPQGQGNSDGGDSDPAVAGLPEWINARAFHTHPRPRSSPLPASAMPAHTITTSAEFDAELVGYVELGEHGAGLVVAASTVNFALRNEREQAELIECFARCLHSQTGPIQIVIRPHPIDLTPILAQLAESGSRLPHPALRAAAAAHHQWLTQLSATGGLLSRQILIVLREPTTGDIAGAGRARLRRRLAEISRCLAPADITVTALSPTQLEQVLATSTDPSRQLPTTAIGPHGPGLWTHPSPHTLDHFGTSTEAGIDSGAQGGWR
jgi:hypothetical protein